MNRNYKLLFLLSVILFFTFINTFNQLYAQKDKQVKRGKDGEIENTEVIIEKNRKLDLPEAERNFEKINSPIKRTEPQAQKYDKLVEPAYQLPDINTKFQLLPPAEEIQKQIPGNYIKGGFEPIYSGTYFEAFLNNNRNKNYSYGLHAKHLGFAEGPVNKKNSATGDQSIKGFYKYSRDFLNFNSSLDYSRKQLYFYGYKPIKEVKRDTIKQIFNIVNFKTDLTNRTSDSLIGYKFNINVRNISDAYKAKEFEFGLRLGGDYVISKNISALINSEFYFTTRKDLAGSLNRNLFRLQPTIKYTQGLLNFEFGLNFVSQNDTTRNLSKLNVYPIGKVYYGLSNHFSVFASLTGDIQRNTLNNFVAENPWINQNISLQNTNKQTDFTAGFKAGIGNALSFQLSGSYERYKNLYFFVNSAKDSTRFDAIYEGLYTKVFKTTGELIFDQNKLRMGLKADFYNYSLTTFSTPFHRPTFVGNFFAKYNIGKNLYFNIDFYYISGIKARKNLTEQQPLSAIADLNLKAEYFLKGNFSVFASLNNVFSNKYQRYLNYSNRGFQSMLGFTYAF